MGDQSVHILHFRKEVVSFPDPLGGGSGNETRREEVSGSELTAGFSNYVQGGLS